jgi:hypothetical protein
MAKGFRKSATRRTGSEVRGGPPPRKPGRPAGKAVSRQTKAPAKTPAKKVTPNPTRGRIPSGRRATGRGSSGKNAALATQLERVGRGIEEIASLRDEIRELRASIEKLVQHVGASLDAEQDSGDADAVPAPSKEEPRSPASEQGRELE